MREKGSKLKNKDQHAASNLHASRSLGLRVDNQARERIQYLFYNGNMELIEIQSKISRVMH